MRYQSFHLFFIVVALALPIVLGAQMRLPAFFSDGMVLQRDQPIRVWGEASPGTSVAVRWQGEQLSTKANGSGEWMLESKPLPAGGPYELTVINNKDTITIGDVLVGDLWICSGQSNMEWSVIKSNDAAAEIAAAQYTDIRLFDLPRQRAFQPQDFFKKTAAWTTAVGENITTFSAVAYFFGRAIHLEQGVPIGLISTNWGGTNVETWTSTERLKGFPDVYPHAKAMQEKRQTIEEIEQQQDQALQRWWAKHFESYDRGIHEGWHTATFEDRQWPEMEIPAAWEDAGLKGFDGVVWFRKSFTLPDALQEKQLYLRLGYIDDYDAVWVNGKLIGHSHQEDNWRTYPVPAGLLRKEGENSIAIKVLDKGGSGGLTEERADKVSLSLDRYQITPSDLNMAGAWKYHKAEVLKGEIPEPPAGKNGLRPNSHPSMLYNAMVHPFTKLPIKGAIWYQGESNAGRAHEYRKLFPTMIEDWRQQWGQEFPFFWVQLANFKQPKADPVDSDWAELREAQSLALQLPKTGMATAIDIGEADDIHPRNKQEVGWRLALAARKVAYGEDLVHSGPTFQSAAFMEGKAMVTFAHTGTGLAAKDKYGYLKGFAVAGPDRQFHWARARILGDQVEVYSPEVKKITAVRYAWADNPEDANLYNKEGLPAVPFRTDEWPGLTVGKKYKP